MNILITGANFNNKGAQLMLESLVASIKKRIPQSKICVSPLLNNDKGIKLLEVEKLNFPLFHYGSGRKFILSLKYPLLVSMLLKIKGKKVSGSIELEDIDAVFDISGFAFGDKWGNAPLKDLGIFASMMKGKKVKFILFPQAFGSFLLEGMRQDIKKVVDNVDLLITRDKSSYEYVVDSVGLGYPNIQLYPDITLTFKKSITIADTQLSGKFVAIVPNERMLDKASANWQSQYTQVMAKIIDTILSSSDLNVVMLIHAQGDSEDAKVGKDIIAHLDERYSERVSYYVEEDPVRLKSIIAKARFIVGSRFHALASALSSNVPCIATSWLHKYEMLFDDYESREFSFADPDPEIYQRAIDLIDESFNARFRDKLDVTNVTLSQKSEEMWATIIEVLKK